MAYSYDAEGIKVALKNQSVSSDGGSMRMKFYTNTTDVDGNDIPDAEATSMRKQPINTDNGDGGISVNINDSSNIEGASLTVDSEGKSPAYSSSGNIGTTTADIKWIILEWDPRGDGWERLAAGKANSTITVADGQQITVQSGTTFYFEGLDPTGAGNDSLPPDSSPTSGDWENTSVLRVINAMFSTLETGSISVDGNTWETAALRYRMTDTDTGDTIIRGHDLAKTEFNAGSPNRLDVEDLSGNPIQLDSDFSATLDAILWVIKGVDSDTNAIEAIVMEDPNPSIVDGDGSSKSTIEGPAKLYPDYFRSTV